MKKILKFLIGRCNEFKISIFFSFIFFFLFSPFAFGYIQHRCEADIGSCNMNNVCACCWQTRTAWDTCCSRSNGCGQGQYKNGNGECCSSCWPGTYQPYGDHRGGCYACPAGRYSNGYGWASCNQCPAGQYQPYTGQTGCYSCNGATTTGGQYQPYTGQTGCYGKSVRNCTAFTNSRTAQQCTTCAAGWSLAGSGTGAHCRHIVKHCSTWGASLTADNWCTGCEADWQLLGSGATQYCGQKISNDTTKCDIWKSGSGGVAPIKSGENLCTSVVSGYDLVNSQFALLAKAPDEIDYNLASLANKAVKAINFCGVYDTSSTITASKCSICDLGKTLDNNFQCVDSSNCTTSGGKLISNQQYGCDCSENATRPTLQNPNLANAKCVKQIPGCISYNEYGYCSMCKVDDIGYPGVAKGSLVDKGTIDAECKVIAQCESYDAEGGTCQFCIIPNQLSIDSTTCSYNGAEEKCNDWGASNYCTGCNIGSLNNYGSPSATIDACTTIIGCQLYNNSWNGDCKGEIGMSNCQLDPLLITNVFVGDAQYDATCNTCNPGYIGNNKDITTDIESDANNDTKIHSVCYHQYSTAHGTCNLWSRRNGYCIGCEIGSIVNKGQVDADCFEIENCYQYEPEGGSCAICNSRYDVAIGTDGLNRKYCVKQVEHCSEWNSIVFNQNNDCSDCETGYIIQNDPNGIYGTLNIDSSLDKYCVLETNNCTEYEHEWEDDNYCEKCNNADDWSVVDAGTSKANCKKQINHCNKWNTSKTEQNYCIQCEKGFHLAIPDISEGVMGKDGILDTDTDGDGIFDADQYKYDYKVCYKDIDNCLQTNNVKDSCDICENGYYRISNDRQYLGEIGKAVDLINGQPDARQCIINTINPQMKSISTSLLTNTIIINQLGDLISMKGVENAILSLSGYVDKDAIDNQLMRIALFGAGSGGYSQYNVGKKGGGGGSDSTINMTSYNSIVGVAYHNLFASRSVFGVFATMGNASYVTNEKGVESLNINGLGDFNMLKADAKGEGSNSYYGGGLLFYLPYYHDMLYSDLSVYGGVIENEFSLDKPIYLTIKDFLNNNERLSYNRNKGSVAGFTMTTNYIGGHIGQGLIYKLNNDNLFEMYVKYLVSVVKGKEICIENCDDYDEKNDTILELKDTISNRAKIGFKYRQNLKNEVKTSKNCARNPENCKDDNIFVFDYYIGANVDYEMKGDSVVKLKDFKKYGLTDSESQIESATLKGLTTEIELGVNIKNNKNLSMDLSGSMYKGVRNGFMGNASFKYRFGKTIKETKRETKTRVQLEEERLRKLADKCGEYEYFDRDSEECEILPENEYMDGGSVEYDRKNDRPQNPEEILERGYIPRKRKK
ncbi:MAG: hypothetical protein Ta2D_01970 [Rickettsiales bacterium]|nr:MAG: hypothetical protein Ta2D_01970 [Rickettsiales bacterium]